MEKQYEHINNMENIPRMTGTWTTGLFDCHKDVSGTLEICFCHMCQLSRQYSMIKYKSPEINVEMCAFILFMDLLFLPLGTMLTTMKIHNILQDKYNFDKTDFARDISSIIFCTPCVICQNYREMSIRNEWTGGFIVSRPYTVQVMQ